MQCAMCCSVQCTVCCLDQHVCVYSIKLIVCRNVCRVGLKDSCVESCRVATHSDSDDQQSNNTSTIKEYIRHHQWSLNSSSSNTPPTDNSKSADEFSSCMRENCGFSEPTLYNPEVRGVVVWCKLFVVVLNTCYNLFAE